MEATLLARAIIRLEVMTLTCYHLSHHPDPAVRDARAIATGNTDAVFMHHYNTEFLNYVVEVTKEHGFDLPSRSSCLDPGGGH